MMKQSIILLSFCSNVFGAISTILPEYSGNNLTASEKMLIQIIKECNIGFKNTIYYSGNNPDLTQALLTTAPFVDLKSWILTYNTTHERLVNFTAIDGIVMVFNSKKEYYRVLNMILYVWDCVEDCKVIMLSKWLNSCHYAVKTLNYLGFLYFDISYYICDNKSNGPMVLTQDKYLSVRRAYWNRFTQKAESLYDGRFYFRQYDKNLCRNFDFTRVIPSNKSLILLGIGIRAEKEADMEKDFIYRGNLTDLATGSILILERIMKIKFYAYIKTYLHEKGKNPKNINEYFWLYTYVDMVQVLEGSRTIEGTVFVRIGPYDSYVILSHKPAEATAIQKIAKFYGIWTLISLMILSIITFVVIYLKSNRNATLAAFDVLRLLINSGVEIPINTLSLKIFFCMIFLYFIVIHSTFSGNLPKFLTIPEFHDTIDSLEDLLNPRISTIYDRGYCQDFIKCKDEKIKKKLKYLSQHDDLFDYFMMDENSVCIIEKSIAETIISILEESEINKIYVSKNDFGNLKSGLDIRRRFYLREQIHRAATYMFDVGGDVMRKLNVSKAQRIITRQHINSQIIFRNISVNDLMFAFIFLIIGNTVGLVCFLIELVVDKKYYRKISFEFFKKCMTFKRKKTRINIRRIEVRPRLDIAEID